MRSSRPWRNWNGRFVSISCFSSGRHIDGSEARKLSSHRQIYGRTSLPFSSLSLSRNHCNLEYGNIWFSYLLTQNGQCLTQPRVKNPIEYF